MANYIKKCPWCLEEFNTKNSSQITCSNSHKTYMSQWRNGKKEAPLIWKNKPKEIPKELIPKKLKELNKKLVELLAQFQTQTNKYLKLDINQLIDKGGSNFNHKVVVKLIDTRLAILKIKEQIFDLKKQPESSSKAIFNITEFDGLQQKKEKYYYDFDEPFFFDDDDYDEYLDNYNRRILMTLGKLPKPFFAVFTNDFEEDEMDEMLQYSMWIIQSLLIFRKSKIIYVVSKKEIQNGFIEAIKVKGIKDNKLMIMPEQSKELITKTLLEEQPEFAFFKVAEKLDVRFFKNLRKNLPKTSFFLLTDYRVSKKMEDYAELICIESEDEKELFKKGGNYDFCDEWMYLYEH